MRRGNRSFDPRRLMLVIIAISLGIAAWQLIPTVFEGTKTHVTVLGIDGGLPEATVRGPNDAAVSGDDGGTALEFIAPVTLYVSAPGYVEGFFEIDEVPIDAPLHLQMEPIILTGRVVAPNGIGVAGVEVTLGDLTITTGEFGAFEAVSALAGEVSASKVAWVPASIDWDGKASRLELTIAPFVVKGLRVDGIAAGDKDKSKAAQRLEDRQSGAREDIG